QDSVRGEIIAISDISVGTQEKTVPPRTARVQGQTVRSERNRKNPKFECKRLITAVDFRLARYPTGARSLGKEIKTTTALPKKRKVVRMDQHALVAVEPSSRIVGMAAIASGVIGIAAFGLLMDAVLTRVSWIPPARIYMLFGAHDIGVALQFLLLISVA